jgi:hypothetical protein
MNIVEKFTEGSQKKAQLYKKIFIDNSYLMITKESYKHSFDKIFLLTIIELDYASKFVFLKIVKKI